MQRTMLKSKIHRAVVTEADLDYVGSITIDPKLLKIADIWPNERVEVYNIDTGARFATYAIPGESGKNEICINGAAAHLAKPGHKVIICSYANLEEKDLSGYEPTVVIVNEQNEPVS